MANTDEPTTPPTVDTGGGPAEHAPGHDRPAGHVCNVAFCPIGLALTAVQPAKPEILEHLVVAGREFFLAAKAMLDARADDLAGAGTPSTFEKIDIG